MKLFLAGMIIGYGLMGLIWAISEFARERHERRERG